MRYDSRAFQADTFGDASRLWNLFAAVESACVGVAETDGRSIKREVKVAHGSGEYHRGSVAEARKVAVQNGFIPSRIGMVIKHHVEADDRYADWWEDWAKAVWYDIDNEFDVKVDWGSEVEVNGLYSVLKDAADAVPMPSAEPEPIYLPVASPPPAPLPWWRVTLNHPWFVGIGASLIVALLLAFWAVVF